MGVERGNEVYFCVLWECGPDTVSRTRMTRKIKLAKESTRNFVENVCWCVMCVFVCVECVKGNVFEMCYNADNAYLWNVTRVH